MVPSFEEETGCWHQRNSEVMGTLTHPLNTFLNHHRDDRERVQSVSDKLSTSPFRTLTIDDDEERRKMLGTYLDTRFPEIPNIFTNCQQYIANHNGQSRAKSNSLIQEEPESNSKPNVKSTIESRDPSKNAAIPANGENDQETQAQNLQIDLFMSRSISSEFLHQLGHMPVSSLNAFMDGEDKIEKHVPNEARSEAGDNLHGSTKLLRQLTPRTSERPMTTTGNERDQALPEEGSTQLLVSPGIHIEDLFGEAEAERCIQKESSLNGMLLLTARGSTRNEAFENIKDSQNTGSNPLTKHPLLRDLTNLQTSTQELIIDNMKELFLKASTLSRKMQKQSLSGSENLKYYSLKRIQKDLNEHLDLSGQLYLTVRKLREQKANLDEACRKEKEEIRRLRQTLQLRGLVPMKKL